MSAAFKGAFYSILSAGCFAVLAILIPYAIAGGSNTITLMSVRFTLAAAGLWLMVAWRRQGLPPFRTALPVMAVGALGYGVTSACLVQAVQRTGSGTAAILLYLYPAFVSIAAGFSGMEPLGRNKLAALILSFSGMVLAVGGKATGLDYAGVMFGVLSSLFYTFYIMAGAYFTKEISSLVSAALIVSGAMAMYLVLALSSGQFTCNVNFAGWLASVGCALFSTFFSIMFLFEAIKLIGPSKVSIISTIEPVLTIMLAIALFDESFGGLQALGVVMVLGGIGVLQRP